jgi:hypothetical protein
MSSELEPQVTGDRKEFRRGQFASVVAANTPLCREHYRLMLRVEI